MEKPKKESTAAARFARAAENSAARAEKAATMAEKSVALLDHKKYAAMQERMRDLSTVSSALIERMTVCTEVARATRIVKDPEKRLAMIEKLLATMDESDSWWKKRTNVKIEAWLKFVAGTADGSTLLRHVEKED